MRSRLPLGFGRQTFPLFLLAVLSFGPSLPLRAQLPDQLAVGSMDISVFQSQLSLLPVPSQPNQQFCTLVQLGPNLLAWAYVPTAAERTGDFSQFQGVLLNPLANSTPFPNNIIPESLIPGVFAWRIAPSGPSPDESCLPVPSPFPQFTSLYYVTGQSGSVQIAAGPALLDFVYTLDNPFPAPQDISVTASAPVSFVVIPAASPLPIPPGPAPPWLFVEPPGAVFQTPAAVPIYVLPNDQNPGLSNGMLTVSAINVINQPVQVAVSVAVFVPQTWAVVDTTSLQPFTYSLGDSTLPSSQQINIISLGAGQTFSITTHVEDQTGNWLVANPSQGVAPGEITLSVDPNVLATLDRGGHLGYVDIFVPGAPNSPVRIFLTLVISPDPDFTITPQTLSFTWNPGDPIPSTQMVSLDPVQSPTADTSVLKFNAVFTPQINAEPVWVTSPNPVLVNQIFGVSLSQAALADLTPGVHSGEISLNSPDAAGTITAGTIPVTLTVGPATATIAAAPVSLQFTYTLGGTVPLAQTVQLTSGSALAFTATPGTVLGGNWLAVSSNGANTPATLTVAVSPTGLTAATYTGSIRISAVGASNSPITVPVTLLVEPAAPASLSVSPQALTFSYTVGDAVPAAQGISITNTSSGALSWTASPSASWISLSNASGTAPATLLVSVNPVNLPTGSQGSIQITAAAATGSPVTVSVTLLVQTPLTTFTVKLSTAGQVEPFAAESIVSAYGTNLASGTAIAMNLPLPTSLAKTTVTVTDSAGVARLASLFYVSPTQVNCEIPAGTATGKAIVSITNQNQITQTETIEIGNVSPGLFALNSAGLVAALALPVISGAQQPLQPVYQIVSEKVVALPINLGASTDQMYLEMYGTGIRHANTVTVTAGGLNVPVLFAGAAPGYAGEDQVNIGPLPRALAGLGNVNIVLTADGQAANTVNVTIQ